MRYINYARRSSDETSKKQVQSIEDQLQDTRQIARNHNLDVVEELTESRSAKEPGRPVFNRMIAMVQRGEADAILCWKLDRLARNPIDAATLRWLMRQGQLLEIRTPYQIYRPEDNAVITAVESAMAEQYIIDLKKGVERGMKSKCEKGGFPFLVPQGYINNRLERSVEIDEERFPLLKKAWEMLLEGRYTVAEIHDTLVHKWGYRNRVTKSSPRGELTRSSLYKIFRNSFYMGSFTFMGSVYVHSFPHMVTREEWEAAQRILDGRGHKTPTRYSHAFTGLITCASCGFFLTAEKSKGHTYYHCNNKLGVCTKKGIREEEVERQIDELLQSITSYPEFEALAVRVIEQLRQEEMGAKEQVVEMQQKTIASLKRQKDALLSLYLQGHLDADEYAAKKQELSQQEASLALGEEQAEASVEKTYETMENVAHFVTHARTLFHDGEPSMKRVVAKHLGVEYLFNNGANLQIKLNPLFGPVRSEFKKLPFENSIIEPLGNGSGSRKGGTSEQVIQHWWTTFLEYRTLVRECKWILPKLHDSIGDEVTQRTM